MNCNRLMLCRLVAALLLGAAGCQSNSKVDIAQVTASDDVPGLVNYLADANPAVRAAAANRLGVKTDPAAVKPLVACLGDRDHNVRAAAAQSLGRSGDIDAMWPLIQTAARDKDASVRFQAAKAVTYLGPEVDNELNSAARIKLLRKNDANQWKGISFSGAANMLAESCDVGCSMTNVAKRQLQRELSVELTEVTVAETWCCLIVGAAPSRPVGFLLVDGRMQISTVEDLAQMKLWLEQDAAKQAAARP